MLMGLWERIVASVLLLVAISLLGWRSFVVYRNSTILAPSEGGRYTEALIGEVKYLSPILAQSDAEKSISRLLFSGLVAVDREGAVKADLAERWEISADKKVYTFFLKKGISYNDGTPLSAFDFAYTIGQIQTPEIKSPLNPVFSGVEVSLPDDNTLVLTLPSPYGPFLYNCAFGVMPAGLSSDEFAKKLTGSGIYKFEKFVKDGNKIKEIALVRNEHYYGITPKIESVNFVLYTEKSSAEKDFAKNSKIQGLFGAEASLGTAFDFTSTKRLGLILSYRDEQMKDKVVRQKIIESGNFEQKMTFRLLALDAPAQHEKAEALKQKLALQNAELIVSYLDPIKFQEAVAKRDYQMLLYGFDFGYDRDPYVFWHTSQLGALNLANWSNKDTDILLEDARMITDPAERNLKYDQFYNVLKSDHAAIYYDPVSYHFVVKEDLKGLEQISGNQPFSRFENIANWYIKEKRVKK